MVKMTGTYEGQLHCVLTHEPSGSKLETDAPKDNQGRGEKFSPTDLVGAALGSCILTTMAIVAERDSHQIKGASFEVEKEMVANPRRIGALHVKIKLPNSIPSEYRAKLEQIAHTCPVHKSLSPEMKINVAFYYA